MVVKYIRDVVYGDYKKASMLIATSKCDWKCCREQGLNESMCQNSHTALLPSIDIPIKNIYTRYVTNFTSDAIIIGGLEPMLQFNDIIDLLFYFRNHDINDDFVIYTGYNKNELGLETTILKEFNNIIVKFGRFIPYQQPHFDEVLGIMLASDNQYAERIS